MWRGWREIQLPVAIGLRFAGTTSDGFVLTTIEGGDRRKLAALWIALTRLLNALRPRADTGLAISARCSSARARRDGGNRRPPASRGRARTCRRGPPPRWC